MAEHDYYQQEEPRMSEWIKVTERLPEEGECVLIGNVEHEHVGEARFRRIRGHAVFVNAHDETMVAEPPPTHWQPLPPPPTKEA